MRGAASSAVAKWGAVARAGAGSASASSDPPDLEAAMPTVADAQVSGRSSASSTESGAEDPPPGGGMVGLLGRMFGGSSAEGGTPAWPLIGAGRDTGTPEAIRRSGWDTAIFDLRGGALGDPETVKSFAAGCERRQGLATARTLLQRPGPRMR